MERVEAWLMALIISWLLPGAAWAGGALLRVGMGHASDVVGGMGIRHDVGDASPLGLGDRRPSDRYPLALWSGQEIALRYGPRNSAPAIRAWRHQ
jgi:hypothetical protein